MKPKTEPLTKAEEEWIQRQLAGAHQLVETFSPPNASKPLTLAALDRAFAAWLKSETASDLSVANQVINQVGVAFGRQLVENLGLRWVIATDDNGSELAVYGLDGHGDVLIYPANLVAKRWERREAPFLEESFRRIAEDIEQIKRDNS